MVFHANRNTNPEEMEKALTAMTKNKRALPPNHTKKFDAKKFEGVLIRGLDGVQYQKEMRNEWEH